MIKISLITPTRNRPNDLTNLLDSLMKTTADKSSIEILFAVDKCDPVMLPLMDEYVKRYPELNITFSVVDRSDHFSKDYFNFLSLKAQGRWIMCINDDSVFMTEGWDKIIDEKMSDAAITAKDDILLGIVNDGMIRHGDEKKRPDMSCWCLSSKEYVTLMNGILIEEIYTWGGDYWLGQIFSKVAYNKRKVYVMEVYIEHNSHHSNPRTGNNLPKPEAFDHFNRIQLEHPFKDNDMSTLVRERAAIVNEYLKRIH